MFVGHAASALWLRAAFGPTVPLWLLIIGASFADFLFAFVGIAGVEAFTMLDADPQTGAARLGFHRLHLTYAPYSHGLAWNLVVSALLCMAAARAHQTAGPRAGAGSSLGAPPSARSASSFSFSLPRTLLALAVAVPSHWVCDFIVHDHDMTLGLWGAAEHGLGLWRYGYAATVLELAMVALGWYLLRGDQQQARGGVHLDRLCVVLAVMQLATEAIMRNAPPADAGGIANNNAVSLLATAGGYVAIVYAARPAPAPRQRK